MKRREYRIVFWTAAAAFLVLGALLVAGHVRPAWYTRGGRAVGVTSGRVELAWTTGTDQLTRQSIAWSVRGTQGAASIIVAPESQWMPSLSRASVSWGTQTVSLKVFYIPLWPWVAVAAIGVGGSWYLGRRVPLPGHCRACDYDLSGLLGGACPECGKPIGGAAARMLRSAVRLLLFQAVRAAPVRPHRGAMRGCRC